MKSKHARWDVGLVAAENLPNLAPIRLVVYTGQATIQDYLTEDEAKELAGALREARRAVKARA